MASAQTSNESTVPWLMASVKKLTPTELRDFAERFAAWQLENSALSDESELRQICRLRLPQEQERRLRTLINKSELGKLNCDEVDEYRALVRHAEKLDGARLTALAQLARLWNKPVSTVMKLVGWETADERATRDPASSSKTRTRPRQ